MKGISVVVLCLIVGTLGVPLRQLELKLLERLVKELIEEPRSDSDHYVNSTWVKNNIGAQFKDADMLQVPSYFVANEILRLFDSYVSDPTRVDGEMYKPCAQLVTSMALLKHFLVGHGKNWLMWQTGSTAMRVILREPLNFNTFIKIDEILPEILEVLTGPTTKALNKLKDSFSNVTGDIDEIEDLFETEEDGMLMDDEVLMAEDVIIETLDALVQLVDALKAEIPSDKAAETCNTTLPTSVKNYLEDSVGRIDTKLNNTKILQKVKDIDVDLEKRLQKFLLPKIMNELLASSKMVTVPMFLMRFAAMQLDIALMGNGGVIPVVAEMMLQITLAVEVHKLTLMQECKNITEQIKEGTDQAILDKKFKDVTVEDLKPVIVKLIGATEAVVDKNDEPCMPLKKFAIVAGIAQAERFKLASKDNPKLVTLQADIIALLKDKYSNLDAPTQQKIEMELKKAVKIVVSKMYISKIIPFVKTINDLKDDEDMIAAEIIPIGAMLLAQNMSASDKPIKEALKPLTMLYHGTMDQYITCSNASVPDVNAFVTGLENADASVITEPVMMMLNNTCINRRTVCPLKDVMGTPKMQEVVSKIKERYADVVKFVTANANPGAEDFIPRKLAELMISGATKPVDSPNQTRTK